MERNTRGSDTENHWQTISTQLTSKLRQAGLINLQAGIALEAAGTETTKCRKGVLKWDVASPVLGARLLSVFLKLQFQSDYWLLIVVSPLVTKLAVISPSVKGSFLYVLLEYISL
ncbi:hypothetical protein SAMN04488490_1791 [Marinobacter sp. LV10R510-11A]|nr:hypothetical protein SAMN04488490_1791 [Marinobacter sp. LV10R510-11A]